LWWKKWHWERFFSKSFGFPLSVSFHNGSILIYHLGDEQQARWWLQFRDIASPHPHKQQYPLFTFPVVMLKRRLKKGEKNVVRCHFNETDLESGRVNE
jgi:hypothetical protein